MKLLCKIYNTINYNTRELHKICIAILQVNRARKKWIKNYVHKKNTTHSAKLPKIFIGTKTNVQFFKFTNTKIK